MKLCNVINVPCAIYVICHICLASASSAPMSRHDKASCWTSNVLSKSCASNRKSCFAARLKDCLYRENARIVPLFGAHTTSLFLQGFPALQPVFIRRGDEVKPGCTSSHTSGCTIMYQLGIRVVPREALYDKGQSRPSPPHQGNRACVSSTPQRGACAKDSVN